MGSHCLGKTCVGTEMNNEKCQNCLHFDSKKLTLGQVIEQAKALQEWFYGVEQCDCVQCFRSQIDASDPLASAAVQFAYLAHVLNFPLVNLDGESDADAWCRCAQCAFVIRRINLSLLNDEVNTPDHLAAGCLIHEVACFDSSRQFACADCCRLAKELPYLIYATHKVFIIMHRFAIPICSCEICSPATICEANMIDQLAHNIATLLYHFGIFYENKQVSAIQYAGTHRKIVPEMLSSSVDGQLYVETYADDDSPFPAYNGVDRAEFFLEESCDSFTTASMAKLDSHLNYACANCLEEFLTKSALTIHLATTHSCLLFT